MALSGLQNLPANNHTDYSNGWELVAGEFILSRDIRIGADVIRQWSSRLQPGCAVLDLGCGFGEPCTGILTAAGFRVHGIDASPALIAEYRRRFPNNPVVCEAAEHSPFFDSRFGAVTAIGLIFLLNADQQRRVLQRVADHLEPGGRLLFSTPAEPCTWRDSLTGRQSLSLGKAVYESELSSLGLVLRGEYQDEGGNHYFDCTCTDQSELSDCT